MITVETAKGILLGLSVGDALGVPVEFTSRKTLQQRPVTTMISHGTHNQVSGTWSDDSSLSFCLAESLCIGFDLKDQAQRFVNWYEQGYWTPHGKVFDVGIATSGAIWSLKNGTEPTKAGGNDERSNGNGSLMRILPLLFELQGKSIQERFQIVQQVSSLTHGHIRAVIACFIYLEYALELLQNKDKKGAFDKVSVACLEFLRNHALCSEKELFIFHRIFPFDDPLYETKAIYDYDEPQLYSSGYVLHTLEAALWCFLNTDSYKDAVLKAVNLGEDTDTTGAVTGGLAGLFYGYEAIPEEWLSVLARRSDIEDLAVRLRERYSN